MISQHEPEVRGVQEIGTGTPRESVTKLGISIRACQVVRGA